MDGGLPSSLKPRDPRHRNRKLSFEEPSRRGQLKFLVYLAGVRGHLPNSSVILPQMGLLGVLGHGLIYLFLTTIQYFLSLASLVSSYPGPPSFLDDLCTYVMASLHTWVPFHLLGTTNSVNLTELFWSLFPTITSFSEHVRGVGPTLPY
jgi:hypothetical protein